MPVDGGHPDLGPPGELPDRDVQAFGGEGDAGHREIAARPGKDRAGALIGTLPG
jgi:hypothetical protein